MWLICMSMSMISHRERSWTRSCLVCRRCRDGLVAAWWRARSRRWEGRAQSPLYFVHGLRSPLLPGWRGRCGAAGWFQLRIGWRGGGGHLTGWGSLGRRPVRLHTGSRMTLGLIFHDAS